MRELTITQQAFYNVLESEGRVERDPFGAMHFYLIAMDDGGRVRLKEHFLPEFLDSMMEMDDGQGHSI